MVSQRGGLAIAHLIFYSPALVVAVTVAIRHGFNRHAGWYFLVLLSVMRIAGASCQLAADSSPSVGIIIAAAVLSAVGLSPLLLAMEGLLQRV